MNEVNKAETKSNESNDEQEDDSSSADEVEPKLKYERLSSDLQNILQKDAVNCISLHQKIICIGTRWGAIYMLDHQGNVIANNLLKSHSIAVNQISMDLKGDFIATCSDDGKAYVYGLYTTDYQIELNLGRCITSIAIDPYYHKLGTNKRFVTGDEKLVLHEKNLFSRIKSTVLYDAVGKIQNIRWQNRFIAWACDVGVRVFDIRSRTSIVLIKWNRNENVPETYPCCLSWKNNSTLLIGWIDTIRICKIEKCISVIKESPEFFVNVIATLHIDYYISGVCPLDAFQLVVLACVKEKDVNGKSLRPQMYILQSENGDNYIEVYTDNLSLRGYPDYILNDYHLECLVDENRFIIASPKDVVIASIYDFDDRIDWLTEHKKFEEAMQLVTTKDRYLQRNNLFGVGKKYIEYLRKAEQYDSAAEWCAKILDTNKEQWENEVFKFAKCNQLRVISQYLPITPECQLNPYIYEIVLYDYLKVEPENFLKLLKKWPPSLYTVSAVMNAVIEQLVRDTDSKLVLHEALAILYTHAKHYDQALNIYLKLKHEYVFQFIHTHNLYSNVSHEIENLMDLDASRAITMFLEKERVPSDTIISHLQHNQYYLYLYLDALDAKDYKTVARKYHAQLVQLYANFAPHKLLPLLRRSDNYPIQEVLNICKKCNLYMETVYLLGRIGNVKEALQLLMNRIGDMEQAIAFCKEHDDAELWEELVECSLSKSEYVTYLMQKISSYFDPRILVRRIDNGKEIPGLKNSLVKMLRDYNLQISVKKGCTNIVVSDSFDLLRQLVAIQQKAFSIDDNHFCYVCHQKMLPKNGVNSNVLIFYCRHSFHEECLPPIDATLKCIICCTQKGTSFLFS